MHSLLLFVIFFKFKVEGQLIRKSHQLLPYGSDHLSRFLGLMLEQNEFMSPQF